MRDDIQVRGGGPEKASIQLAVLGYYGGSTMKCLTPAEARDLAKQLNDMADAQDPAYGAPTGSAHGEPDFRDE